MKLAISRWRRANSSSAQLDRSGGKNAESDKGTRSAWRTREGEVNGLVHNDLISCLLINTFDENAEALSQKHELPIPSD